MFKSKLSCLALVLSLSACTKAVSPPLSTTTSVSTATNTDTAVPTTALKADWAGKHDTWTPILAQALKDNGQELLTGKYTGACDDRLQFYVMLFSAIALEESSWKPGETMKEVFNGSNGQAQVSAGLLQVSLDDAGIYGCPFKTANDIIDVKNNLVCGVKILSKLTARDGVLTAGSSSHDAKGGARYWSTMRTGPKWARILAKAKATCVAAK